MCNCVNIEAGSYGNQSMIKLLPIHMAEYKVKAGGVPDSICVDNCILNEVRHLWSLGITTTGCCCGHNYLPGYIGVIDEDIQVMKDLGYEFQPNTLYPDREDGFKPKTV